MKKSHLLGAVSALILAVAGLSIWLPTSAVAGSYLFTKIVDTNDAIPGGAGNFINFGYPTLDGNDIAFSTYDDFDGFWSVLTYKNGTLTIVADSNTLIPGGVGTFERVFTPKISQGKIIFGGLNFGSSTVPRQFGIYTDLGGRVRSVVDLNTPIPGSIGTFNHFLDIEDGPLFSHGVVAFDNYDGSGVYAEINGTLRVIADQNTPEPGGSGDFDSVGLAGIHEGNVIFYGGNAVTGGIYLNSDGNISKTNYTGGHIDFLTGSYSVIEYDPDSDDSPLSYFQRSLYLNVGGIQHHIADINDITPNGIGSFTFFDDLAVDGDELAILAVEDYVDGNIYRYADGVLDEVISVGDTLDGKTVTNLGMWNDHGFDNSVIAFQVEFDDGSSGIYLATPVPNSTTAPLDLGGTIKTADGQDICAMVLASGQFMFSCNPVGVLSLSGLPRETNGTVKRQIYADGFFPKIDTLTDSSNDAVIMTRSGTCPNYNANYNAAVVPGSAGKRIDISGKVLMQDSQTPICAMVLANGQYRFSCDGTGSYVFTNIPNVSENIPLDTNGQFKLQVYADGFAPTIQTFDEFSPVNDVRMARSAECQ